MSLLDNVVCVYVCVYRYAAVGYLECDPGQCEFTCPEVLSLHVLRAPVFGPPYAHQRSPIK